MNRIETIAVAELTTYPGNPRRGNIDLIRKSVERRGQYKPIIISEDNVILAGNHTYLAMVELGKPTIEAIRVNLPSTDPAAREIVLVDNRSADIGGYDEVELIEMLQQIPNLDLAAIGYGQADFEAMIALLNATDHDGSSDQDVIDESDEASWPKFTFQLPPDDAARWESCGESDKIRALFLLDQAGIAV